jgi:diadenosine tetraphosphate (Ap4A) HIT family hydrolase
MSCPSCPFCQFSGEIVAENGTALALSDSFPVSEGHTLVVPRRHVSSLFELCADEQSDVWQLVSEVRSLLIDKYNSEGFNIGLNDGDVAGQTVMHAHVHVIPRHEKDCKDPRGGIRWVLPEKANYWE